MAREFSPFNETGNEGRYEPATEQGESMAQEQAQYTRLQLEQDLAALIDDIDYPYQSTDESTYTSPTLITSGPSIAIILLSAASAIAGFIIALYVSYRELAFSIEASAAIATLFASASLGVTGAALSAVTQSRAATSNIAFSCGLILISLLFFGLCLLVGAVAALLLIMVAG